jgi:hypothetical protein
MTISPDPNAPQSLTKLRAGGGPVNLAKLRQVITIVILAALAILSIVFFFGGAHTNSQITSLREHGVPITAKATTCEGLLGGSGSNAAGYICKGEFTLNGKHYNEPLPGSTFERPGTPVKEISLPSDPGLLETPSQVATDRASNKVYVLPIILLAAFLVFGAAVVLHTRRRSTAG